MFDRPHHQRIGLVLYAMNGDLLRKHRCYFGVAKAEGAYGHSVLRDLGRAIHWVGNKPGWLARCMQAMQMTVAPAVLRQNIRALKRVLPKTAKPD